MTNHNMNSREIMALIEQIAKTLYNRYVGDYKTERSGTENVHTLEDLCSAGKIGFMEAEKSFDPSRSSQTFKQFASYRIRYAILDHVRTRLPHIRVPQKQYEKVKKLEGIKENLKNKTEGIPDEQELKKAGVKAGEIPNLETLKHRYISTSSRVKNREGESPEFETRLACRGKTPEEMLNTKTLIEIMHHCIENIRNTRDRFILIARYLEETTLEQLASTWECNRETIRLRQKAAEESVKKCMKRHGVIDDD